MPVNYGASQAVNEGILWTDQRFYYLNPYDMAEEDPNHNAFLQFITKLKVVKAPDPDYRMFQYSQSWDNPNMTVNSGTPNFVLRTQTTDITLDTATYEGVAPADGLMVEVWNSTLSTKKCVAIMTGISGTSGSLVKLTPVWVNGTQASAAGDKWFVMGHSAEEHSGSPDTFSETIEVVHNSASILKTPVEISGTMMEQAELRGYSSELAKERRFKRRDHMLKGNKSLLFSRRIGGITEAATDGGSYAHIKGSNGKRRRTTHGFIPIMEDYASGDRIITQARGSYGWSKFVADMKKVHLNNSGNDPLFWFVGDDYYAWTNYMTQDRSIMGDAKVQIGPTLTHKTFGFRVNTFEHPWGTDVIVRDKTLTRHASGLYSNYACVVDPNHIMRVKYRGTGYQTSIHNPDLDGRKDQFFDDFGLGLTLPSKHSLLIAK